jgi:hypothetical protein
MKIKKRLFGMISLLVIIVFFTVICFATESGIQPSLKIEKFNLSFSDSIYIKYAVSIEGIDNNQLSESFQMLFWTEPHATYEKGSESSSVKTTGTQSINNQSYYIFDYKNLSAKQMTDVIYARAYIVIGDTEYYSDVEKYSVLDYVYTKLGKTGEATTNENLKTLLTEMLSYGSSAQTYFNYKTDRLSTAEWYQVKLTAGVLDDGCRHGLYLPGDKVTLTAPETDANGDIFSHWVDGSNNEITTLATYELTVEAANMVYTPIYKHTVVIDVAVAPTCTETGLTQGSHCSVCGEVIVAQEVIETTGHDYKYAITTAPTCAAKGYATYSCHCGDSYTTEVDMLGHVYGDDLKCEVCSFEKTPTATGSYDYYLKWKFYQDEGLLIVQGSGKMGNYSHEAFVPWHSYAKQVTKVILDDNITWIGDYAFYGFSNLTDISLPSNLQYIGENAFYGCCSLTTINIPNSVFSIGSGAFINCSGLTSFAIPDGITTIYSSTFAGCSNLTCIELPDSITTIG